MTKFFRFNHISDARIEPGDIAVFIPKTLTPVDDMTFTMGTILWRVIGVQSEQDAWAIHARRA